jgi:hypothetical protein
MTRTLLAVLAGLAAIVLVLGWGRAAQAVTRSECSIRHAICMDGCQKDRNCERRCHTKQQQCLFKAN